MGECWLQGMLGGVEFRGEDSAIRDLADRRSPQLRRYQLLGGGKNQLSSGTALPCCVSLVNLLNFSGLTFPHIHSLVTGSLRGLHESDCHSSWFRVCPGACLFCFPGKAFSVPQFPHLSRVVM